MRYWTLFIVSLVFSQCTLQPKEECEECSTVKSYELKVRMDEFLYSFATGDYNITTDKVIGGDALVIKPGDLVAVYVNLNENTDQWYPLPQNIPPTGLSQINKYNEFVFIMHEDFNTTTFKHLEFQIRPENKRPFGRNFNDRPYSARAQFRFRVVVSQTNSQIKDSFNSYDIEDFTQF